MEQIHFLTTHGSYLSLRNLGERRYLGRSWSMGLLQRCWSRMSTEDSRRGRLEWARTWHPAGPAAGMLAEGVGQPILGWKRACCTVEKCCQQLRKMGRRERRSGKLRLLFCTKNYINQVVIKQYFSRILQESVSLSIKNQKVSPSIYSLQVLKLLIQYSE